MKQTIKNTNKRIDELLLRDTKYKKGDKLKTVGCKDFGNTLIPLAGGNVIITRVYIDNNKVRYDAVNIDGILKGTSSKSLNENNLKELPIYITDSPAVHYYNSGFGCGDFFAIALFTYSIGSVGYITWQIIKYYIGV